MLPLLYHAHHNRYQEDLPFWLSLAHLLTGPLMELGCGTGRVLLPLARAGYRSYGLDRDASMLAVIHRQLARESDLFVRVLQADLTCFHLAEQFRLILLPCNTFSSLGSASRLAALQCIRDHLSPGGTFAFSVPNPTLLASLPAHSEFEVEDDFPHPIDGEPVQVSSGWERSGGLFQLTWHYDHLLPDGRVERTSLHTRHHLTTTQEYLEEINTSGLKTMDLFGDFDRSPLEPEAPTLIITAQRV